MAILLILCVLLAVAVCVYGFRVLPALESKVIFGCMSVMFAAYITLLYLLKDDYISELVAHICFYVGQFLLYMFVRSYTETLKTLPPRSYNSKSTKSSIKISGFLVTPGLPTYLAEQGIIHVLSLPLFYLIQSLIRYKIFEFDLLKYESVFRWLLWASGTLVLIDVVAFFNEPQNILNLSSNTIHLIDFGLFIWSFIQLLIALKKHRDISRV